MVDSERLVKEFAKLVSIDSESFAERKMADYLLSRLEGLGLSDILEDGYGKGEDGYGQGAGNIYARLPGNLADEKENRQRAILFSAHMDTVVPGKAKKAVFHPDGRITSDGTTVLGADDAAGIAEILEMLQVLQEGSFQHPDIEVVFPVAEEVYGVGSAAFDHGMIRAKTAYIFDLSGPVGRAAVAAPSLVSFKCLVKGKSAHAGFCPEQGINAIQIAARAIASLPQGFVAPETTVNIGIISGGTATNIVSDSVSVRGEIRSMKNEDVKEWLTRIQDTFAKEAEKLGGSVEFSSQKHHAAYQIEESEFVVEHFKKACAAANLTPELIRTFGGSDNNNFVEQGLRGIVVACAMNDVHTTKEWTHKEELVRAAQLLVYLAVL